MGILESLGKSKMSQSSYRIVGSGAACRRVASGWARELKVADSTLMASVARRGEIFQKEGGGGVVWVIPGWRVVVDDKVLVSCHGSGSAREDGVGMPVRGYKSTASA